MLGTRGFNLILGLVLLGFWLIPSARAVNESQRPSGE